MKTPNPLDILFAGATARAVFIDGSEQLVHVRALPLRHLHHVIATYEHKHLFVELCTYLKPKGKPRPGIAPDIAPPTGFVPVPAGWSDNLSDASLEELYRQADELNFPRAIAWAKGQIAAKQKIAPLIEQTTAQVMPLVRQVMAPVLEKLEQLSSSAPSAPDSSASPAKRS